MDFISPDLVAILTGITGILLALTNRRKLKADAANAITESAVVLVVPLKNEIMELRDTNSNLQDKLESKEKTIRRQNRRIDTLTEELSLNHEGSLRLVKQIEELDEKPVYGPKTIVGDSA